MEIRITSYNVCYTKLLRFETNCAACHAPEDVTDAFDGKDTAAAAAMLASLNEISDEMEPFGGTDEERNQLAGYLIAESGGKVPPPTVDGAGVFDAHCSACHAVEDITGFTSDWDRAQIFTIV